MSRRSLRLIPIEALGTLSPTSSSEDVATYMYESVVAPLMRETRRVEYRTGDDDADYLRENKERITQLYDETVIATFDDPPELQMLSVIELIDSIWPEIADDVMGILHEKIAAGVQAEP